MDHPITFRKFAVSLFLLTLGIGVGSAQQKGKKKPVKRINPAMAAVKDVEGLPRVLLVGDSISIGYTVPVRELMAGKANVHRPLTNCGPTTVGLAALGKWLETGGADKKWDVIHFNWGLHDLKYLGPKGATLQDPGKPENHQQVPPDAYRDNLVELVKQLKATGAKLIWRNTTPVPEGARGRVVGDSVKYNKIAEEVMKDAGIEIHDLYSFAKERQAEIQKEADVHFSPAGYEALAGDVVSVITAALKK